MAVPAFSPQELEQSLSEVGWGLTAWEVLPAHFCAPGEARAKLDLLESGDSAVVAVSSKGWKVCLRTVSDLSRLPEDSAAKDEQSFEDLDHLLAYLSPLFENRRIKLLSDKLENLAVRRDWGEGQEEAKGDEHTKEEGKEVKEAASEP